MNRHFDPTVRELMDEPQPQSSALARDLSNLESLNRLFGSHALSWRLLRPGIRAGKIRSILDLAAGGGDVPRHLVRMARRIGAPLSIEATDAQPSTLAFARERSKAFPEIAFRQQDILEAIRTCQTDTIHCSLALHHFAEKQAIRILEESRQRPVKYLLFTDLRRSRLATFGIWLIVSTVFREPMTRHDATLSARRAFSFRELRYLAETAGWSDFRHGKAYCFRQFLLLEQ